ncbi:MAG: LamG domain-containing protein [Candidatus Hydrogenedentes bacterium]|nr:LamG domain-containing protein [Candidatus Hydrogenedentota bacterium]
MSDPVQDFEYARNAVTLTFDLSGYEHVRLSFKALEYGDEPHAPPPGPFGDDVNFDGVAVSADGVNWCEIQDLRNLRSDKFTAYDIDLDVAVAALGLSYGSELRIRFCQYDDNPAPMDGFSIQKIEVAGDLRPPILHLTMNDNAASPTVVDASAGHHDQTLVDPGGNPNTDAHSVPGRVGTALNLLSATDIDCGTVADGVLAENRDFAIAFWWKSEGAHGTSYDFLVSNRSADSTVGVYWYTYNGNLYCWIQRSGSFSHLHNWPGGDDGEWHHYVTQRRGTRIEIWRDGVLGLSDDGVANSARVIGANLYIGRTCTGGASAGAIDDLRVYDRALLESEIQGLRVTP